MKAEPRRSEVKNGIGPLANGGVHVSGAEAPDLEFETCGDHTNDGEGFPVQSESLSHNVRSGAKLAIPESFADQHDGAGADLVFALGKKASYHRLDANHRKVIRRNEFRGYLLRFAPARQTIGVASRNAHRGKRAVVLAPVAKVWEGDGAGIKVWFALGECHELLRVGIGQRVQEHSIHDGKQRGVCADSQRQGQNRHGGKTGRFRKHAYAKTKVLYQAFK